ncbi:ABC transporter ATP-binding protein [Geofilum rubicundum]|uniref:Iron(III) dicitrate transport ATP-binding protein n=1 Tax=Geofilum rubicundum JCM 15548 TaxID=1236989 RepID=A0A0E9M427_9BACT|nr:ABC transporter ATP-binding protein [Geofilum rubicundum]GAO31925.1 iron(III) dicitrate transport ATP-binding protein [Geofilum rubicundum JCM 15548]
MRITFKNIHFAYHKKPVLKGLSGYIEPGGFYAVIGPNGCGKSTFIKCLNNLLHPQKGEILIHNTSIQKYKSQQLARTIGYVAQSSNMLFPLDVYSTVMLGRRPHVGWLPGVNDRKIVMQVIEKLGLQHKTLTYLNELSGGEQQRVHIARALAQQPAILMLDEPTSSLDLKYQMEVMKILKEVSQQGITVVASIHDLNLALRFATHFILMKEGRIIEQGEKDLVTEENVHRIYDTKMRKITENESFYFHPC